MQGGKERRQLLCCRGARRAWRGEALRTTPCAPWIQGDGGGRWLCSRRVVIESRRCFSCLGSPPSQLAAGWPWPADAGIGPSGGDGISFTVHPWVPEIRPINISRSKMKQGLTWYRLQRLRTALSRHGCAPLASPPPRIELCALELICRDHARDAGTLRH